MTSWVHTTIYICTCLILYAKGGTLNSLSEQHVWLSTKAEVQKELQPSCSFRDEIEFIYGFTMKGRIRILIPASLQDEVLK